MSKKPKKIFKPRGTGWLPHKQDYRNANWNKIFGAIASPPPSVFSRLIPDYIPFQGDELACVACTAAADQEYGSRLEDHNIKLSFRELYGETPGGSGGRNYLDVVKRVKYTGIPEDTFCPNSVELKTNEFLDMAQFRIQPLYNNAAIYRIKSYSFLTDLSLNSLRTACFRKPIWIAFPGNNADWSKDKDEIVNFSGKIEWYHSVLMIDWNNNLYNGILNWWGDRYRKLSINYPIMAALSTEDLPDNWQSKDMNYVILPNGEQFLLYEVLRLAFNIADPIELADLKAQGLNVEPKPLTELPASYIIYPLIKKDRLGDLFGFTK